MILKINNNGSMEMLIYNTEWGFSLPKETIIFKATDK